MQLLNVVTIGINFFSKLKRLNAYTVAVGF